MSNVLERSLSILEFLARHPDGMPVSTIAQELHVPASAAHRLLNELARFGYVRQLRAQGDYALTIKLAAMGLSFLGQTGVTDIAQPILDRLAAATSELIRLSVIDDGKLVWVGVAQGATTGLRYDPGREQGVVVHLASSAGGQAWLSALSDEEALEKVGEQGLRPPFEAGPDAPSSIPALLSLLGEARKRGYAVATNSYLAGMAAMAVPVFQPMSHTVVGCLSIAGPAVRLTPERMADMAPLLKEAANEIAQATRASRFFDRALRQQDHNRNQKGRMSA
ncbi:MAG: IclR family transcriptional regulator [Notoacmeibacter sp.]|nr:IclR family transcriptional regulator [Notoacmeibacter sp.]